MIIGGDEDGEGEEGDGDENDSEDEDQPGNSGKALSGHGTQLFFFFFSSTLRMHPAFVE